MMRVVAVEGGFALATVKIVGKVLKGINRVPHPSRNGRLVNHKVWKVTELVTPNLDKVWKTLKGAQNALDKALNPG